MVSSVPSPHDNDPYADRRVYPRVPVAMPAFLQADGVRHAVQLVDISPAGAKLHTPANLPVGMTVLLECGTLGRAAAVRWQNGGFVGLCFDRELGVREISALVERSKALAVRMETRE